MPTAPALQKIETYGVRHCYVEFNNAGVLGFHRVYLTKKCEVKVSSAKLEFSGDGQKYHKNYGYQAEGQVESALDDNQLDNILWGLQQYTPAAAVADPSVAPTPTAAAGTTSLQAGVYTVGYTYKTANGETKLSPTATVTLTAGQQINVAALAAPPAGVTQVNYYVSQVHDVTTVGFSASNASGGAISLTQAGNATTPPAANTTGSDDFSVRYIKGGDAEMASTFVGLRISLDGEDVDTGAPLVVRYRVLKVQFDPDTPPAAQTETAGGRLLNWSARRAVKDIAGNTPTGMPANGCFWLKDIVTDATKFDPVAGDVL